MLLPCPVSCSETQDIFLSQTEESSKDNHYFNRFSFIDANSPALAFAGSQLAPTCCAGSRKNVKITKLFNVFAKYKQIASYQLLTKGHFSSQETASNTQPLHTQPPNLSKIMLIQS